MSKTPPSSRRGYRSGVLRLAVLYPPFVGTVAVGDRMITLDQVRGWMSTAEIIARLSAAAQKLEEAKAKAAAAAEDANAARTLVAGALDGSAAGQLVGLIDRVREGLSQAGGATGPAKRGVDETIAKVQALGN